MKNNEVNEIISQAEKSDFSGVISISQKGETILQEAFGYADRANARKNEIKTKFGIASGTKFFTALAIGKLVADGKLSCDAQVFDIVDYDFPTYSKDVTVRHLLMHTSGLPDYFDEEQVDDFDNFKVAIPWHELNDPKDYFPVFPKETMKFQVGERFSYNNSGYILLAAIVAKISKMRYIDFVQKAILTPCGMDDSGFYAFNKLPENTAFGYIKEDDEWRTNIYNLPIVGAGDGGMYTTAGDMNAFWENLLSYKILNRDMTEMFLKPHVKAQSEGENLYYGNGVWIYKDESLVSEYIVGCDAGVSFKSQVIREKDMVLTVISNTTSGAWPITKLISSIVKAP